MAIPTGIFTEVLGFIGVWLRSPWFDLLSNVPLFLLFLLFQFLPNSIFLSWTYKEFEVESSLLSCFLPWCFLVIEHLGKTDWTTYSMFPIKRTVFLCSETLVKNTVRLIGNIEYMYLHCVRSVLWCASTLDTILGISYSISYRTLNSMPWPH